MEKFKIGGVEFFLSKGQVEQKLNGVEPEAVREVYVEVDKIKYPIKQALAVAICFGVALRRTMQCGCFASWACR